jgi:hypothetical protein
VFTAGVGTSDNPVGDDWSAFNQEYLWFRSRPQPFSNGDHVFALGAGWRSAILGLYEVTRSAPLKEPQKNKSGDPERWPWNIAARALATVPPPLAIRVEGVQTPRGTANQVWDTRQIRELYAALDPPAPSSRR